MSRQSLLILFLVCSLALPLLGCGPSGGLTLAKVRGTITLDGKPLTKGTVQFTPDGSKGTRGPMALGKIEPDGRFVLTTTKPGDGAPVGFYRVSINCWEDTGGFNPNSPTPPKPPKSLIPEHYADDAASGLVAEVKSGERNEFTFALQK